ncbi:hypothetical protein Agub_g8805 [Astrephomene gubernaculifera]|uniref:Uncharacterized protein n=1 Tax=Astrephomene gubernaculifera TaxID=47775 RepID=A0AAD3HNG3_9CHLO|nr:hypothetical protein Agub_g8805 [Astrephomene gubernaculifera]
MDICGNYASSSAVVFETGRRCQYLRNATGRPRVGLQHIRSRSTWPVSYNLGLRGPAGAVAVGLIASNPCIVQCAASSAQGGGKREVNPLSLEAAVSAMDAVWSFATERKVDELLHFIPDEVVEQTASLRSSDKGDTHITLQDVITHSGEIGGFTLDSFAERLLYFSPPTPGSVTRLSCIRTAPERAVLRYLVAAEGGERAILTFGLECAETLMPHYRSLRVEFVWQLISVTGEPAGEPAGWEEEAGRREVDEGGEWYAKQSHPSLGPEAVVQAQLAALASEDVATVFSFASPANKALTGPLERFELLLRNPVYRPLLRHRHVTSVRRTMLASDSYSELVKVVSDNTGMPQQAVEMTYLWHLSRQPESLEGVANCWMTDSVRLLEARVHKD